MQTAETAETAEKMSGTYGRDRNQPEMSTVCLEAHELLSIAQL